MRKPSDQYDPDGTDAANERTEAMTDLDLRSLKVRAYLETLTGREATVEKRSHLPIARGALAERTIEVRVTPTSHTLLGMRGVFAVRFRHYLDLHLAPESSLGY